MSATLEGEVRDSGGWMTGAVSSITMTVTSLFVTHRQYQAMRSQTIDQGASLAKLIAVEHSHQTLSEDWVGIDVSVQAIARALDARGLSVIDIKNIVRVKCWQVSRVS